MNTRTLRLIIMLLVSSLLAGVAAGAAQRHSLDILRHASACVWTADWVKRS